jgi:anti-sigma factor RsiW
MNSRSFISGHWTDEQLVQYVYGVGPQDHEGKQDNHVESCDECRSRLTAMQLSRRYIETHDTGDAGLNADALAAQRRAIWARLEHPPSLWQTLRFQVWAPAACALLVLSAGFAAWEHRAVWEQPSQAELLRAKVSDEQLADEVGQVANHIEPEAAAPLQALFEN